MITGGMSAAINGKYNIYKKLTCFKINEPLLVTVGVPSWTELHYYECGNYNALKNKIKKFI